MTDCLFCRLAAGEIPARIALETDDVVVFHDIAPAAPVHVLAVPRRHVESFADVVADDADLLFRLVDALNTVARQEGLSERGYRVLTNVGVDAGQTVQHLHLHLLGGRPLGALVGEEPA